MLEQARTPGSSIAPPVTPSPVPLRAVSRVAVCDDDVRFIRLVERILAEAGASVVPVTTLDHADAVRVVAEAACDAALVDLNIYNDHLAGLTLVRLLREYDATANLALLLVTASPLRDLKRHDATLRELDCGLLCKPFAGEDLFAALGLAVPTLPAA